MESFVTTLTSQVKEVAYDSEQSLLYIEFKGGAVYEYDYCTPLEWSDIVGAIRTEDKALFKDLITAFTKRKEGYRLMFNR